MKDQTERWLLAGIVLDARVSRQGHLASASAIYVATSRYAVVMSFRDRVAGRRG